MAIYVIEDRQLLLMSFIIRMDQCISLISNCGVFYHGIH